MSNCGPHFYESHSRITGHVQNESSHPTVSYRYTQSKQLQSAGKPHSLTTVCPLQNALFEQLDGKSTSGRDWSQSDIPHQQLSMRSGDELSAIKREAGQRHRIIIGSKVLKAAFVVIHQLQQAFCKNSDENLYDCLTNIPFLEIWWRLHSICRCGS